LKLFLSTNHRPEIRGRDQGIWRRVKLIPFDVVIPDAQQDHALIDKLQAEGPGILRWAVEGCLLWQKEGLEPPNAVKDATKDYRSEMDVISEFIDECCVIDPAAKTPFKDLFEKFKDWSWKNGDPFSSQSEFARTLTEQGVEAGRNKNLGRYRSGIRLK